VKIADIFDPPSMVAALAGSAIAINLATTLPGPSGRGDFAGNDRLRTLGVPKFLAACRAAGVTRVVQQGIAFVNATGSAAWSDEDHIHVPAAETVASRAIAAALAMQASVRSAGLDWIILRGGLFYGPGTGLDDDWFTRARAGTLRLPGDGADYVSLIHIADMAAATLAAVRRWPSGAVLNICDDEPAPWRDVLGFVAASAGVGAPEPGGRAGFPSFRLRNTRAADALGWRPFYATYREGLAR
jgi:nucleoside-diphosphate-sugar epimerase